MAHKRVQNHVSPKMLLVHSKSIFRKSSFDPFLIDFWPQKQPVFQAPCDFEGAKTAYNGFTKGSFHLFVHPKWSRIIF